jgi:hypothetical protein
MARVLRTLEANHSDDAVFLEIVLRVEVPPNVNNDDADVQAKALEHAEAILAGVVAEASALRDASPSGSRPLMTPIIFATGEGQISATKKKVSRHLSFYIGDQSIPERIVARLEILRRERIQMQRVTVVVADEAVIVANAAAGLAERVAAEVKLLVTLGDAIAFSKYVSSAKQFNIDGSSTVTTRGSAGHFWTVADAPLPRYEGADKCVYWSMEVLPGGTNHWESHASHRDRCHPQGR